MVMQTKLVVMSVWVVSFLKLIVLLVLQELIVLFVMEDPFLEMVNGLGSVLSLENNPKSIP